MADRLLVPGVVLASLIPIRDFLDSNLEVPPAFGAGRGNLRIRRRGQASPPTRLHLADLRSVLGEE